MKHHGHKGDPGVTPGTCDAIERAQLILVWEGCGNPQTPKVPDWQVFVPNPDISG
jgi:hypothetical protein